MKNPFKKQEPENKPTIIYQDTLLFFYSNTIDSLCEELNSLTDLNEIFKGRYEKRLQKLRRDIKEYQDKFDRLFDEIEAEYTIINKQVVVLE